MSKVGQKIIEIPTGVTIELNGQMVKVKGKDGEMTVTLPNHLTIIKENNTLLVKRDAEYKAVKSIHGLFRSLVNNAIIGVEKPWEKKLEVVGTGFNAKLQGEDLVLKIGFSHPVLFKKVVGIKFALKGTNTIIISGVDKEFVGRIAYQIKKVKKPDAYKGKGIRYLGEKLRIKPGK